MLTTKRATSGATALLVGCLSIATVLTTSAQTPDGIQLVPLPAPASAAAAAKGQRQPNDPFADALAPVLRERLAAIHTRGLLSAEQKLSLQGLSQRMKADIEIRLRSEAGTPRYIK